MSKFDSKDRTGSGARRFGRAPARGRRFEEGQGERGEYPERRFARGGRSADAMNRDTGRPETGRGGRGRAGRPERDMHQNREARDGAPQARRYEHRRPSWERGPEPDRRNSRQGEAARGKRRSFALKARDSRYEQRGAGRAERRERVPIEAEEIELREDRLEGRNPVQEALRAGRQIDKLWVQKAADGRIEASLRFIAAKAREAGAVVMEVEKAALEKMTQTNAHQGVIAQCAMHEYADLEEILEAVEDRGEQALILVLDEIKDAYNLGAMLRIAESAGAHAVVIPKRRAVGLDAVVAKASAGAIEYVPCCRVSNLRQALDTLKAHNCWVIGTSLEAHEAHSEADLSGPLALVIGSEGEGMRPSVAAQCDMLVRIPMNGKLNSLNAAVAAGIVVFEALRQRKLKQIDNADTMAASPVGEEG